MTKVAVQAKGIKNRLKSVKPYRAIAEYIWNGFDAEANTIDFFYTTNALGNVNSISISDNGRGIPFHLVDKKFEPVLSSEKRDSEVKHTLIHGKNGLGRLTFFHFAQRATWKTVYFEEGKFYEYEIVVQADSIDNYTAIEKKESNSKIAGTTVIFDNIVDMPEIYLSKDVCDYLRQEFAWFLELKKDSGFVINMNGNSLSYKSLIRDEDNFSTVIDGNIFEIEYIRWSRKLNRHFSRYYCITPLDVFKYSSPTTLNNKGDEFYHSIFVQSEYFTSFVTDAKAGQADLISPNNDQSDTFRSLTLYLNNFLRERRKPFIIDFAQDLVNSFEADGIFPAYNEKKSWEKLRHEDLRESIIQLCQIDPRIFSNLNMTQKKTFVSFIALIIDSGDIDDLFKILEGVVDLTSDERERFARQLKTTKMSSIVNTIEIISDRYKSVDEFRRLVFEPGMYAGEVPHLQKMMEKNYWLIGEEYQLLTAAEPKFEEALRRYTYILSGVVVDKTIEHESKNKEMDLFLIRQGKKQNKIENIVLELKHPVNIRLGKKEFDQLYDYYQVIRSEPMFNGSNMEWKFYLIGNDFDSTGYVNSQIVSHKNHGEPGLAFSGEYKIYVFKWSEIFTEFELKHDFLNKNLKLELHRLSDGQFDSADDIVSNSRTSDAPAEIGIVTAVA